MQFNVNQKIDVSKNKDLPWIYNPVEYKDENLSEKYREMFLKPILIFWAKTLPIFDGQA